MDRTGIRTAARLLAKAESTDSDAEAAALALRSYKLLADTLNTYDEENASNGAEIRRRERRLLKDRRAPRVPPAENADQADGDGEEPTSEAAGYKRFNESDARPRRVDYSL